MQQANHSEKFYQLRQSYPCFVYESFSVHEKPEGISLEFCFSLNDELVFKPTMTFAAHGKFKMLPYGLKQVLAFNIGMAEMISYWKATCSPRIIIKPFRLTNSQESWWKKLFRFGLGEFFYTNGIAMPDNRLLYFEYAENSTFFQKHELSKLSEGVIIPVGGGKDSVVTLELLKNLHKECYAMVVNQRGATREVLKAGGFVQQNIIEVSRSIDPMLIKINQQGFLNGHTPFSALLAFVSTFAAALTGKRNIALSNESSANEPSIPGTNINHQYSKSFEFEQDFRAYLTMHLAEGINYFSFLRPLNELQIAALFSRFKQYHKVFKSCNAGSKTDTWCCSCPKCLFTYIVLSPFIAENKLNEIFGENLFEKKSLAPVLYQLSGLAEIKPFECVGTIDEVNAALRETIKQCKNEKLPHLLEDYEIQKRGYTTPSGIHNFIGAFHHPHALERGFVDVLKKAVSTL